MRALAGIISHGPTVSLAQPPQRMFDQLCHHVSHVPGSDRFPDSGLMLGWISDRTVRDEPHGPSWSESRRVAVVITGDPVAGTRSLSASRVATALANDFEHRGTVALQDVDGWFSGVVVDTRDHRVVLFNDRFGRGRVYYHASARGFFFASEAKALLAVLPELRQLDPRAVAELFSVGCVMQNRSLFAGISLLPPGSAWTFSREGEIDRHRYFAPAAWEQQPKLEPREYGIRLREVFARVARAQAGSSAAALSLTGGLDSRAVMAWSTAEPGTLPCYTFGGPYRDCADVLIARRLAALCRHPHTTIRIRPDFFACFSDLAARSIYLSDGTMDVSGAVELHVNQQAREIAPVRLTGNYGSEILRSHVAFRPARLDRSLFTPAFNEQLDHAEETYRREADCDRLSFIAFKQVPWHHHARFAIEHSQLTPRSPFLANQLVALAYQAPPELARSAAPLLQLIAQGNPKFASIGTDRALTLRQVPFVSQVARSWRELTAKAEYAYDYGMPRWLARADAVMTRFRFEKLFLGRHKFYHFRVWYRDQLREVIRAHASTAPDSAALGSCYRAGAPAQLAQEHLSGQGNRTLELHRLLTLQLIERQLLQRT